MAIGGKLWEGEAKAMGMTIKGANADAVMMEYTWMAQLKGMGKAKGLGIWSFMTMSPKLNWMNMTVALTTQEGDPQWTEFDVVIWEWK